MFTVYLMNFDTSKFFDTVEEAMEFGKNCGFQCFVKETKTGAFIASYGY